MTCHIKLAEMQAAERLATERARQKSLAEIEGALANGQARIVKEGGRFRVVGASLPTGMTDLCALAALQQRNSAEYRRAVAQANAQSQNFAQQHALTHQRGGHGGHGH